jgi:hypothetical protein
VYNHFSDSDNFWRFNVTGWQPAFPSSEQYPELNPDYPTGYLLTGTVHSSSGVVANQYYVFRHISDNQKIIGRRNNNVLHINNMFIKQEGN